MEKCVYNTVYNCDNCGTNHILTIECGTTKEQYIKKHLNRICNVCKCKMFDKEYYTG